MNTHVETSHHAVTGGTAPRRSTLGLRRLPIALLIGAACCVMAVATSAQPAPPAGKGGNATLTTKDRAALLAEITRALKARNVVGTGIDRIVANLGQMDMAELQALAGFGGVAASGSERLLAGSAAAARDRAGELTGQVGGSGGGGATSSSERGINSALTPGMRGDARSQLSSCQACPDAPKPPVMGGVATGGIPDQNGDVRKPHEVSGQNGETIKIYGDGSASIASRNGKTEYINSGQRLVDKAGNAKEPAPDSDGSSGRATAGDVKRIAAIINRHRQPTGDDTGSGGPVDTGRTDPTGSRGLYTESRLGAGYVSEVELKEIVRLSVEKLQGPQVGK